MDMKITSAQPAGAGVRNWNPPATRRPPPVIENGRSLLSNVVASQIDLHVKYGGVFPEVASRQHIKTIYAIIDQALQQAHMTLADMDAIAVTRGPGLAGSLVVGMNTAKGLALASSLPLIGVNHLEGHIYSSWVYPADVESIPLAPQFPLMALLVSGGHTELNLITGHLTYKRLGATLDDAAGEAFDKVARLLGLPYPGGPSVQNAAAEGQPAGFPLPPGSPGRDLGFLVQRAENGRDASGAPV